MTANVPDGKLAQRTEVCGTEVHFHCMQVREEPEEWLLLEHRPLVFVHIGQYKDADRQDFSEVMYFFAWSLLTPEASPWYYLMMYTIKRDSACRAWKAKSNSPAATHFR
jgi:hypothetical protein